MVDLIPLYCAQERMHNFTYPNSSCCTTFLPSLRCAVCCLTSEMLPAQSGEQADTDACPPGKTPNLSKQHRSPVNLGGNRPQPLPARLHEARPFNTACIEVCRPAPRSGESTRTAQNRHPRILCPFCDPGRDHPSDSRFSRTSCGMSYWFNHLGYTKSKQ